MPPLEVRSLQPDDLPALMAVQRAAYGDGFMESTEVFARRLASPVNCSLALLLDGALCAYLAAYHSVLGKVTPLHGDFEPPVGTGFMESTEVFARRLASPVNCSLALLLDGALCAYLAAYHSVLGKVTPLHGDFEPPVGTAPDTLYLHDMAVLPGMAGQGLPQRLLQPLWEQAAARGLRQSALVSVQGSEGYWQRHGYVAQPLHQPEQQQRLASYGEGAVYMARTLQAI